MKKQKKLCYLTWEYLTISESILNNVSTYIVGLMLRIMWVFPHLEKQICYGWLNNCYITKISHEKNCFVFMLQ